MAHHRPGRSHASPHVFVERPIHGGLVQRIAMHSVVRCSLIGVVQIAGNGTRGYRDGSTLSTQQFFSPQYALPDPAGSGGFFIADYSCVLLHAACFAVSISPSSLLARDVAGTVFFAFSAQRETCLYMRGRPLVK